MKKAAAEAAEKEEQEPKAATDDMQIVTKEEEEEEQEAEDNSGKKWSLEDDSDEDDMDIDGGEDSVEAPESTFKPLLKPLLKNDDESKDDSILAKPKKAFLMSNKSTKPTTMRMGFGMGKSMMKKAAPSTPVVAKKIEEPKPEPVKESVDTVMEDSDEIDPLEAYMMDVHAETRKINEEDKIRMDKLNEPAAKRRGSLMEEDEDDGVEETRKVDDEDEVGDDPEDILA